ncbi:very short patch repair endonuclease [Xanthomonas campestris]|uniref:very short patch repair endonuclease n=1 Tax=Xanthomonas campestris TaxID=339 RepID=UPI002B39A762|nr:DNA mismatch endonuclease Vsr [Xanthomonas campestris pv. campestris]
MTVDEQRSRTMRAVRSQDTKPELIVRRLVHSLGFRFRLHRKDLPGKPDLVFPSRQKIILVHGCFWHGHHCARGSRVPKTNSEYWLAKIARNRSRDQRVRQELGDAGWKTFTVWECELSRKEVLGPSLFEFLNDDVR